MKIFLALGTRICLFRFLFGDGSGAGTAQSLLFTSFVCPYVCVMCVYEYASIKYRIESSFLSSGKGCL